MVGGEGGSVLVWFGFKTKRKNGGAEKTRVTPILGWIKNMRSICLALFLTGLCAQSNEFLCLLACLLAHLLVLLHILFQQS